MSAARALAERRRVLALFAATVLPPLVLLTVLAWAAASNDEAALQYLHQEQARQGAARARDRLEEAILSREEAVFTTLDPEPLRGGDAGAVAAAMEAARAAHPVARRFFALTGDGRLLWPPEQAPFQEEGLEGYREELPREPSSDPAATYLRRAALQGAYAAARDEEERGALAAALSGYQAVSASPDATGTLAARAAARAAACLERLERGDEALAAWARVASAAAAVRDERGSPLRVRGALRRAELLLERGRPLEATEAAHALGRSLLDGTRRADLTEPEWREAHERLQALLERVLDPAAAAVAAELGAARTAVSAGLEWRRALEGDLGREALRIATGARPGEVGHLTRLEEPPFVLACRAWPEVPGAAGRPGLPALVLGFQLDLERLAADVLGPACAEVGEEGLRLAVVDARGQERAAAGPDPARPDARHLEATAFLESLPLWSVRATPAASVGAARSERLLLYGALIALAGAAALVGAGYTIRYVERTLELAKMKSDFISNITHELKTPLTSIKMYAETLLLGRARTPDKHREYCERIVRESERLHKLIEDVLDFARSEAGQKEYVLAEADVADTVAEAIDLFRHSAKVEGFDLFVELPPVGELPPVDLDRDAVVRAVLNLLSNAAKYSAERRFIKVSVAREGRDQLAIGVEDRGMGIDSGDLERIFDRFYRAGDELTRGIPGAGLGLALVDQIVQAHGGQIRVESEKGQGSLFTILLPIVPDYRDRWPPPEVASADETVDEASDAALPGAAAERPPEHLDPAEPAAERAQAPPEER